MTSEYRSVRAELPTQVAELVDAFRNPLKQFELLYLLGQAGILESVLKGGHWIVSDVTP
jgi:hypothetical protein